MNEIKYEITDDFIATFDNVFPDGLCEKYIEFYDELAAQDLVHQREKYSDLPKHHIDDSSVSITSDGFYSGYKIPYISKTFVEHFWALYPLYAEKYTLLKELNPHQIYDVKIQKTEKAQGYHIWHCENYSRQTSNRLLAFTMYLNDVQEGGETEFLYIGKRIKAQKNRLVIWPAGFTHAHRGNPPLTNSKYILTGWVEF